MAKKTKVIESAGAILSWILASLFGFFGKSLEELNDKPNKFIVDYSELEALTEK